MKNTRSFYMAWLSASLILVFSSVLAGCAAPRETRRNPEMVQVETDLPPIPDSGLSQADLSPSPVREDRESVSTTSEVSPSPSADGSLSASRRGERVSPASRTDSSAPPDRGPRRSLPISQTGRPVAPADGERERVVVNFDQADLVEVIRTFAELLEINYILGTGVQGAVTIHTAGELDRRELFAVFFQILEVNGLTAVKEGGLYKILPLQEAPRMSIADGIGSANRPLPPDQRMVLQIIPLDFISADEMAEILTPFISSEGTILSNPDANTLLLVDKDVNVLKALRLVETFDVDLFEQVAYRFYSPRNLTARELAKLLEEILGAFGNGEQSGLRIMAIERLNKILVLASNPKMFRRIEEFLGQLDVPSESAVPRVFIYPVRNGSAEDLADLLTTVFSNEAAASDPSAGTGPSSNGEATTESSVEIPAADPFGGDRPNPEGGDGTARAEAAASPLRGIGTLSRELKITPDPVRNLLIIEAVPPDYQTVEEILRQIDILPRQVLIEVLIAEISLDDQEELGVEWSYEKGEGSLSTSLLSAQMGSSGLQFALGKEGRWSAALSSLASENKLNVLSRPTVLASDNKEARINVSTQVPVASAQYLFDSGPQGVTQTNIQYRDTGIILSVTPRISDTGMVSMEITQEVSESGDGVDVGGQSFPSFRERKVNTSLTVGDGQPLFIGGLMRERKSRGNAGVPYLSRIPVIGFLFGRDTSASEKSELILMITPRVVRGFQEMDAISEEFEEKVGNIRRNLDADPGVFPPVR
ncbi:MAG: type II secretion system secretin GspD [Desulfococcaceae bacterium]